MIKHSINNNYFEIPNVINCYHAGFIAADGCILDKNHTPNCSKVLDIRLNIKDKIILDIFKEELQFSGKVYNYKDVVELKIVSNKICADLNKNFNIVPRKSLILNPPNITDDLLIKSYIIGYTDGDGSIMLERYKNGNNFLRFQLLGTKQLLNWINVFINRYYKISLKNLNKCGNIFKLMYSSKEAQFILNDLNKLELPKLDRKWVKLNYVP